MQALINRFMRAFVIYAAAGCANADIHDDFPISIDPQQEYVIYSHGLIVEGRNSMPVHPEWGQYDFPAIKAQLDREERFQLIAHHRPESTEVLAYVDQLVTWVNLLVAAGVPARKITLIGFSRGGELSARAASALKPLPINTILLATCWGQGVQTQDRITFAGRFLSVYEQTDGAGSCERLASRSELLASFAEVKLNTGLAHGAFFTPLEVWIDPVLKWLP